MRSQSNTRVIPLTYVSLLLIITENDELNENIKLGDNVENQEDKHLLFDSSK